MNSYKRKKNLAPIANKEDFLNLTSFSIKAGTFPKDLPCFAILESNGSANRSHLEIEAGNHTQESSDRMSSNCVA